MQGAAALGENKKGEIELTDFTKVILKLFTKYEYSFGVNDCVRMIQQLKKKQQ